MWYLRQTGGWDATSSRFADILGGFLAKNQKNQKNQGFQPPQLTAKAPLNNQEELELVMAILERNGFHPRTREEYIVEDGRRTKRVVRDIFFISDQQIQLARRFVSGFLYKTDTTFNTNTRRLPLVVIVSIDNTGHTIPMAFMFVTSESAKSF